jgi:hypothetical protein
MQTEKLWREEFGFTNMLCLESTASIFLHMEEEHGSGSIDWE